MYHYIRTMLILCQSNQKRIQLYIDNQNLLLMCCKNKHMINRESIDVIYQKIKYSNILYWNNEVTMLLISKVWGRGHLLKQHNTVFTSNLSHEQDEHDDNFS